MDDHDKSKEQLVAELAEMRQRVERLQQAEVSLRESVEHYRSFVQRFRGIAYRGRIVDFSVVFFHGAVEEITGYSEEEFTSGTITWDKVICPDDLDRIRESVEGIRTIPGYATEREYRIRRKDGDTRWLHEISQNICDDAGQPTLVEGVLHDITDQKQAEKALEESEQRWRSLIENAPNFVTVLDRNGVVQFLNRTQSGRPVTDAIGKSVYAFIHTKYHDRVKDCLNRALEMGETGFYETAAIDSDGNPWWFETHVAPYTQSGEIVGVLLISTNITQRKEAERLLQEAHEELENRVKERTAELAEANEHLTIFKHLADSSVQGFGIADLEGRITYVNPALSRLLAEDNPDDMLGKDFRFFCTGEGQKSIDHATPTVFREGTWTGEVPIQRKDGTVIRTFQSVFLMRDDKGTPQYISTVISDISELKRAQDEVDRVD
jgi:PAS domain S-box-containing protein